MNKFFAAFVMTYERPELIGQTVSSILQQTFPPDKILVVDNSLSHKTEDVVATLHNAKVEYYRVGFNAGPAGASRIGLKMLADEGYQWIFWGDDDNPPDFPDSFEKLFAMQKTAGRDLGIMGAVGQYFKSGIGEIQRVKDHEIREQPSLMVDSIAGGQCMIVNSNVVKAGVLPDEKLFFGFEELDFCLKAKKTGYSLMVNTELFLRAREKYNRLDFKPPFYQARSERGLIRQYYSIRNLLFILKSHKLYRAFIYQLIKCSMKSVYGFRFGIRYGALNFKYITRGVSHSIAHRLGKS